MHFLYLHLLKCSFTRMKKWGYLGLYSFEHYLCDAKISLNRSFSFSWKHTNTKTTKVRINICLLIRANLLWSTTISNFTSFVVSLIRSLIPTLNNYISAPAGLCTRYTHYTSIKLAALALSFRLFWDSLFYTLPLVSLFVYIYVADVVWDWQQRIDFFHPTRCPRQS